MIAVIHNIGYVIGFHLSPEITFLEDSKISFDLVQDVPEFILNVPDGYVVRRDGEGQYALVPTPPTPPDRIAQLEQDQLAVKLAIAELASVGEQDKINIQLALAELAGLIAGGEYVGQNLL